MSADLVEVIFGAESRNYVAWRWGRWGREEPEVQLLGNWPYDNGKPCWRFASVRFRDGDRLAVRTRSGTMTGYLQAQELDTKTEFSSAAEAWEELASCLAEDL